MTFAILGGGQLDTGYTIDNSLIFNDGDSPSLTRTPGSGGNRDTFTTSFWFKRGVISNAGQRLWSAGTSIGTNNNDVSSLLFESNDTLKFFGEVGGSASFTIQTNQVFRDVSSWYHIVLAVDSTQATSSNRIKIYVNGSQITSFSTASYMSLNTDTYYNATNLHVIGYQGGGFPDGYYAEFHHIDGQQLDASSFGEFDADSGIWKPKQYTGTYGTNGFYLDFEDSGSLGADQSGNGNDFTPTNLASTDQTTDTPTNNFCTLNPLDTPSGSTFSEGNLKIDTSVGQEAFTRSTIGVQTGKWYFEAKITTSNVREAVGIYKTDTTLTDQPARIAYYSRFGHILKGNTLITTGATFGNGDIIGTAFDLDVSTVSFYKNGSLQGTVTSIDSSTWTPMFQDASDAYACGAIYNFGNPPTGFTVSSGNTDDNGYGNFEYAPPSGYLALCTQNLATELSPTIDDGSEYFHTILWTGDGSNPRSLTGVGFQPDWLWTKARNAAFGHNVYDSSRGDDGTAYYRLETQDTASELAQPPAGHVTSLDSDGFSVTNGSSSDNIVNNTGTTYVAWNWLVNGGSTSSNTDGDITSTVQVNTTAGFSIVQFTKTGDDQAVGHGLGKKPKLIIIKPTNTTGNWIVMPEIDGVMSNKYLLLNGTDALGTDGSYAEPTSSVFYVSNQVAGNNTHIGYVFTDIEGYSKFGKYTGNGSSDGTFVYTGFRPAWILIKRTNTTENWIIADNKRDTYNVMDKILFPNTSGAENTGNAAYDFLSNGFKFRNTSQNESGATYIYMAFAENPFVSSTAIPVTAR
jgi:hypothetical protein